MPDPELKLNYLETLMHLVKGNIGTGIFAMGDAIKNAGIILGPILVIVLGVICVHCQHLLTQAASSLRTKHGLEMHLGFAETVELCFAQGPPKMSQMSVYMKRIVNFCLIVTQLGFCCVYFIFISDNVKQVSDQYGYVIDIHLVMVFCFIPVLLPCLIRNLKYLISISMTANVLMIGGIIAVIYYAVSQGLPPLYHRDYVASVRRIPLFFGTAIFCFEGIGLILPLKNEMKVPHDFSKPFGVLNIGMAFVTSLSTFVGFIGYLKFGNEIMGSITLNLPEKVVFYQVVKLAISLGVLLTYCLQLYVVVSITWPFILAKNLFNNKHPVVWELFFRASLVSLTFVLAQVIPFFRYFISLVGSVCSAALCLLFPAILDIIIKYVDDDLSIYILVKDSFIVSLSLLGMLTGGYESISSIIIAFRELNEN